MAWSREGEQGWADMNGHRLKVHRDAAGWWALLDGRPVVRPHNQGPYSNRQEAATAAEQAARK